MTQPSAYDPSTWGSEDSDPAADITAKHAELTPQGSPEPLDDAPVRVSDADALIAERDELRVARDGAARKLAKLRGFVDAGEAELGRLTFRLEAVERELAGLAGGEPDGVER